MTNANIIERLHRNDNHMDSIQLQIQSGSDTSALVEALSQANKVINVAVSFFQLYNSPFLPTNGPPTPTATAKKPIISSCRKRSRSEVAQPDLMATIGSLPKLQQFSCSGGLTLHTLPVSSLLSLLQEASQLESLRLSRIQLQGCAMEFEILATSLRTLTSLRHFSLQDCKLAFNASSNPPFALDAILKSLASLPILETIQVTTKDLFMGILTPESVELLCCSSSLQKLILKGFSWNTQHIVAMGPGVANSKTLKQLVLPSYNGIATPKVIDCLAYMLQDNTCLEHFEMPALQAGASQWIPVATRIVQTNTQLRVLKLGGLNNATNHSIRLHLKLNQAGRSQLLAGDGSTNNREWVNAMGKVTEDLDCMFYFLSQNPSLCESASL